MAVLNQPQIICDPESGILRVCGGWSLRALSPHMAHLRAVLASVGPDSSWSLSGVTRLDSFGATLLWGGWQKRWPERIDISVSHKAVVERVAAASAKQLPQLPPFTVLDAVAILGGALLAFRDHAIAFIALLGQLCLDVIHLLRHPREWPLLEISANLFKVGVKAMPVTALVGFLIGVVLSYLSALQLKAFGADVFIVNILGLGIIRELGPVLVSVLVAGRSG